MILATVTLFLLIIGAAILLTVTGGFVVFSKDGKKPEPWVPPDSPPDPTAMKLRQDLEKKFRTRLADIAAGKGNTAQAAGELKNLGIRIDWALQNPEIALSRVLDGLFLMKSPVGKSSVATCLFGSGLSSRLMAEWNKTCVMYQVTNSPEIPAKKPYLDLNGRFIPIEESEVKQAIKDKFKVIYK